MASRTPHQLTRRTTVGVALLTATGCTVRSGKTPSPSPSPSPVTPDRDGDLMLVDEARVELLDVLGLLRRTAARHPTLASSLTALVTLHQAHDAVLAESAPDAAATQGQAGGVPRRPALALQVVRRREAALQSEFAVLAGRAASGPLARLLASMSAATAQHLVKLPLRSAS